MGCCERGLRAYFCVHVVDEDMARNRFIEWWYSTEAFIRLGGHENGDVDIKEVDFGQIRSMDGWIEVL